MYFAGKVPLVGTTWIMWHNLSTFFSCVLLGLLATVGKLKAAQAACHWADAPTLNMQLADPLGQANCN